MRVPHHHCCKSFIPVANMMLYPIITNLVLYLTQEVKKEKKKKFLYISIILLYLPSLLFHMLFL